MTTALPVVVSVVLASPFEFVVTFADCSVPAVVEKVTGTPASALPDASRTCAVIVTVPPVRGTTRGFGPHRDRIGRGAADR